jgi:alcohol dehydrogenase (cytochrome c)
MAFRATAALFACAAAIGVVAARQADAVRNPLAGNPAAADEGARLFAATCQACHGAAAQGDRDRGAPPLVGGLSRGNDDADLFRTIRSGVPGTQMPPFAALTDEQVWQVVSYLRTLQEGSSGAAGTTVPTTGDPAIGEELFFGRAGCAGCHEVNARGGITGPDLSSAGRLDPAILRHKIVAPDDAVPTGDRGAPPPPTRLTATSRDGRVIVGVRRNEDTYTVQLVDRSGQLHLLDKTRLVSLKVESRSLMPSADAAHLTPADIDHLVAFLSAQRARDLRQTALATIAGGLSGERLRAANAEPQNWLMYWGDYHGTHSSTLAEISPASVSQLRTAWTFPLLTGNGILEATPIVVDGVMYVSGGGNPLTVVALDARSGRQIWRWTRPQKAVNPYGINPYSRGVAVLGPRVFVGTLDGALVALDARSGRPLWENELGDVMEGYSLTSPPLAVDDKIITGVAGGEYATRGFIDAYDAATGKRLWRFYSIPGPGEPGHDSWKGESWKTGGGATWLTGTYDPDLRTLFWPVGNPAPQFDRTVRGELDNLYTDSVVALDVDTGRLKWHYQFTPNDGHDWDSAEDMMLVDRAWRGQPRKLLLHADRNGHFYVLDRTNGTFLSGTSFVFQNWNAGFDPIGRPRAVEGSNSSAAGSFLVYPTVGGATNFQAPSYSAKTTWFYLAYSEAGQQYVSATNPAVRGQQYLGRAAPHGPPPPRQPGQPAPNAGIKAIDPESGRTVWDFKIFQGSLQNGVLATDGGLVFASSVDGNLTALDARSGRSLWHFQTGGTLAASPMTYAIDGKQYVAVAAGSAVFSFALPD